MAYTLNVWASIAFVTYLAMFAEIFDPARILVTRNRFVDRLLGCEICTATWVAAFGWAPHSLIFDEFHPEAWIGAPFAAGAAMIIVKAAAHIAGDSDDA